MIFEYSLILMPIQRLFFSLFFIITLFIYHMYHLSLFYSHLSLGVNWNISVKLKKSFFNIYLGVIL